MLDVKRLRVLKEVAARGSFSAAGEALGYTQSAISQQVAALERETGSTLVERGARGIRLTDAGQALVDHADGILARIAAAEEELARSEVRAPVSGRVVALRAHGPNAPMAPGTTLVEIGMADATLLERLLMPVWRGLARYRAPTVQLAEPRE